MQLLSIKQIIIRIAIIISCAEFIIMLVLGNLPYRINLFLEAVIDVVMLVALSAPLIYLWIIQPFVNARDDALAQIQDLANLDPLTHLANRRLIWSHLEKMIAGNVRHRIYGALLLLDLDGFKQVNDALGHDAGDAVLVEIAKRIRSITRSEDVVGRLGGDEFVVVLNHLDIERKSTCDKASQIAGKLIDVVKQPVSFNGKELQVGASIGIRLLDFEALHTEAAIRDADTAMYRAKQAGKGRAVIFEK